MLETGKIKLFTHSDLDGVSCGIILKAFFNRIDVELDIEYCSNPQDASKKVKEFWENLDIVGEHGYTKMFITDISINDEVAEMINETGKYLISHPKVALIDHHVSAEHLNKYDWSFVMPEMDGVKESGTSLFLKVLCGMYDIESSFFLNDLAETVRQYDTWEFSTIKNCCEKFVPVDKYSEKYLISNWGNVKSLSSGKMLIPYINKHNVKQVTLYKDGIKKKFSIHQLVGRHFIHNPFKYNEINHKDGNRQNNHISNLEWVYPKKNRNHSYANQLKTRSDGKVIIESVKQLDIKTGDTIKIWESAADAERELGIKRSNICKVCDGKDGRRQAGGYTWRWNYDKNGLFASSYYEPQQLNSLLYLLGKDRFINRFREIPDMRLTSSEKTMLEIEEERNQRYIERKIESMQKMTIEGYNAGVVVAERCVSDLGNQMCKLNPDIDIAVIIGSNAVSFRAIKDDIDVSKLANMYGGGGHHKASGAPLPEDMLQSMVKLIFN